MCVGIAPRQCWEKRVVVCSEVAALLGLVSTVVVPHGWLKGTSFYSDFSCIVKGPAGSSPC